MIENKVLKNNNQKPLQKLVKKIHKLDVQRLFTKIQILHPLVEHNAVRKHQNQDEVYTTSFCPIFSIILFFDIIECISFINYI